MNTELLNRINMNDVYVKKFINNATDEQMEFFADCHPKRPSVPCSAVSV